MARGTLRVGARGLGVLTTALALFVIVSGCGSARESTSTPSCSDAILSDWADGRIDGTYDAGCYHAAIDALPEDLRAYSSAEDDISRALVSLRASDVDTGETASRSPSQDPSADASTADAGLRQAPATLVALTGVALVVVAAGLAAALARRHRRRA